MIGGMRIMQLSPAVSWGLSLVVCGQCKIVIIWNFTLFVGFKHQGSKDFQGTLKTNQHFLGVNCVISIAARE